MSRNAEDFTGHSCNYSRHSFWKMLGTAAKRLGGRATWYALILYYTLESGDVSLKNKAIIIAALGYLIAPIDLIPDAIPVLGFTDDAAALKLAYDTVKASITPDIERQANEKVFQWFGVC